MFSVVPAIVCLAFAYSYFTRVIVAEHAIDELGRMERLGYVVREMLGELSTTFSNASSDGDFRFFQMHGVEEDISRFYRLTDRITSTVINSRYLHSYNLVSHSLGFVWTDGRDGDNFTRDLDGYQFLRFDVENRIITRTDPLTDDTYLSYVAADAHRPESRRLAIVANIKLSTVRVALDLVADEKPRSLYLRIGKQGIPVATGGVPLPNELSPTAPSESGWTDVSEAGRRYILTRHIDHDYGFELASVVPRREYLRDVNRVSIVGFGVTLSFLLIAVFIALVHSRRLYLPIGNLVKVVGPGGRLENRTTDEFETILRKYSRILESNRHLQEALDADYLLRREQLLSNLLLGHMVDKNIDPSYLGELGLELKATTRVIALYVVGSRELMAGNWSEWRRSKADLLRSVESTRGESDDVVTVMCELPNEELALVFSSDSEDDSDIVSDYVRRFLRSLSTSMSNTVRLGISGPVTEPQELAGAYRQSRQALRIGLLSTSEKVHYSSELSGPHDVKIDYDASIHRLGTVLQDPTGEAIENYIASVTEHARSSFTSYHGALNFYSTLIVRILDLVASQYGCHVDEQFSEPVLYTLTQCRTNQEVEALLATILSTTIEQVKARETRLSSTRRKVQEAARYIDSHFDDSSLTLSLVAEAVGSNASYLSRVFSREMGRSFQEYVYRKRIEAAKKLITSTDDPFHQISSRCGFGSPLSFYRAFRKLEDCTPKEYRIRATALVSDET